MFIYAVTADTPHWVYVCLSVFAIFIYVDVEVRGQHLVLFSDNLLLGFFLRAGACSWALGFPDSVRLMGQQYLELYLSLSLSTKTTRL